MPGALGSISDVATAVRDVVEDPCLFPVAKIVSRLNDLQQPGGPSAPGAPRVKGVGLCTAVRPLKVVEFIAERPWVAPVGAFVLLGGLFALGYMAGRSR
ncbi:MAG TPA: hypothetical protein VFD36_29235 [Kofleriaceae bacterium]|nr:hypothetical protein [Kofleriaceae bacterium]